MRAHRHRLALSVAWVAALLASGCGGPAELAPTSQLALSGTVSDQGSGVPIHGAQVTFVADTLEQTNVYTDGNGRYSMVAQLSAGVRFGTLRASASGYQESAAQTVYFDGTTRRLDLQLRAKGP